MPHSLLPSRILIVDDNQKNLDALSVILAAPGLEIVQAHSGEDALRLLLNDKDVALIFLDVCMSPGVDGFECARLIRSNQRHVNTPIIFLTAVATDMEFIFKGYASGGVDYLTKPFEPSVVKAKAAVFVELFRSRQAMMHEIKQLESLTERLRAEVKLRSEELHSFGHRHPAPIKRAGG